jgi:hypothetical protein
VAKEKDLAMYVAVYDRLDSAEADLEALEQLHKGRLRRDLRRGHGRRPGRQAANCQTDGTANSANNPRTCLRRADENLFRNYGVVGVRLQLTQVSYDPAIEEVYEQVNQGGCQLRTSRGKQTRPSILLTQSSTIRSIRPH